MKRLVIKLVLAVALFGMATAAEAVKPAVPAGEKPYLHVTTSPDELDLGTTALFGMLEKTAAFTLKVESNCAHGPITMTSTALKHSSGVSISAKRIFVQTNVTDGYVSMEYPVVISKPETGSHKIVVDVKVNANAMDLAGSYSGSFTFTITPPV